MYPELIHIGPVTIYTYGTMMAIGFIVSYLLLQAESKKLGDHPNLASDIVFWAAVGGIAGSKLLSILENIPDFLVDPIGMIFSGSGLVFHGGLIGGTIAVILVLRKYRKSIGVYADIIGPLLLVGQGFGRIGCFFAGCCHGKACDLPWAITFPHATPPADYPVHPTQLYEAFLNFGFFFILTKVIRPRTTKVGHTMAIYLMFAGVERFLIEFIRVNPRGWLNLSSAQFTSIGLFCAGLVVFFFLSKPKKK
ncbi:MAG: prolipoprotein diacylglyceryl transferase [Candidatus Marinimicrobia bacterium]|jgi:phosphatidylglycerol:prolipoprotein diacylglycerol transferase|nr:prolipoprotein diacylglyceryl transferase [Candidatus Neomarinimicrobiota bacterium]MCK9560292.1 prolipoprotein diacylglyceryl transferase [Candidatus Neomarinimicrobiota bacterium]MDD5061862.1 prolipoprotein diacylglyceryl transferase [Candidatus Neomarinimicrobiota bacterium]